MSKGGNYLAIDIGAESGRLVLGSLEGGRLSTAEVYRFANEPVWYGGHLHWDLPRLLLECQRGIEAAARQADGRLNTIGVDTWGLDFALLSESGALLDNPVHYRDPRNNGMMDRVWEIVPPEEIYASTGVQFMQINSLYQLFAAQRTTPELLRAARHFVMIPDLLNYWFTGQLGCEFTNATTTQFFDIGKHAWAHGLLDRLGIPYHFLSPVIEPGTVLGPPSGVLRTLCPDVAVVAPATHDTGSAVAGIPLEPGEAYISSGTWSLLGAEVDSPVLTPEARAHNFTNEGGVAGTTRLLKNIAGLWLVQSCRRHWASLGRDYTYAELMEEAAKAPALRSMIDPDDPSFLNGEGMPDKIAAYCTRTGQPVPETPGAVVRTALECLALKYRFVLEALEEVTGVRYRSIRVVGGGARNSLLNQFTADATGRTVVAGPVEATALGNLGMQIVASGGASGIAEIRRVIDASFPAETFHPADPDPWQQAWLRFRQLCQPCTVTRT